MIALFKAQQPQYEHATWLPMQEVNPTPWLREKDSSQLKSDLDPKASQYRVSMVRTLHVLADLLAACHPNQALTGFVQGRYLRQLMEYISMESTKENLKFSSRAQSGPIDKFFAARFQRHLADQKTMSHTSYQAGAVSLSN